DVRWRDLDVVTALSVVRVLDAGDEHDPTLAGARDNALGHLRLGWPRFARLAIRDEFDARQQAAAPCIADDGVLRGQSREALVEIGANLTRTIEEAVLLHVFENLEPDEAGERVSALSRSMGKLAGGTAHESINHAVRGKRRG